MGEEQVLGWTKIVNALLGKPVAALLALLHVKPENADFPISNAFAMELLVVLIGVLFFLWLKGRISADRPGATQQVMELVITNPMGVGVKDLVDDIVGHGAERHIPILGTIGLFILMSNMLGLVPGLMSPTAERTVPLGCAVIVFLYYNRFGIGKHGPVGYAKTLMGPVPAISPIMVIVETISHFARLLSLTVRLWANMMVSELIYVSFLGLSLALFLFLGHWNPVGYVSAVVPIAIPLVLALFHVFEAVLQAFIFTILAIVYLNLATAEEH
ncbi:MAG TPA: F0F1 ATP synthase subunit A [Candidatus Acidoferrales bacterium]|jgi:F-type H+-transporting ATPase subunit a|nr:F0F1 ATP synthase subunit A [Candidatus Acidoferrales bacterium]